MGTSASWIPRGVSRDCVAFLPLRYTWPSSVNIFMSCDFFARAEIFMNFVWSYVSETQCDPCKTGISPYFVLAELAVNVCNFKLAGKLHLWWLWRLFLCWQQRWQRWDSGSWNSGGRKHLATDCFLQKRRICWVLLLALLILYRSPFWDGSSPSAGNEIFSVLCSWNVYRVYT